jgi:retron-type reverse transcriptase
MKAANNVYNEIISPENLFSAWDEFKKDKRKKKDVQKFEWKLEENIFQLYRDLKSKKYKHGTYTSFHIQDPKQRHIHKATVRDRVLHHAIFKVVNPVFEPAFISHSFSCRVGKGTHKGIDNISSILRRVSGNSFKPCFALKCDIKKFFDSIDHNILIGIIQKRIRDKNVLWLLEEIIESFTSSQSNVFQRKGLPIGNLTSQFFANIYLNEFDQFIKHNLRVKNYCRYTDDFVIIADNRQYLADLIPKISNFLSAKLQLNLHPKKVSIRKFHQGIDFLGYVSLPHYRALRTKTRQRIFKKFKERTAEYRAGAISSETLEQSLQSYLGVLSHADSYKLSQELKNQFWFWTTET